MRHIYLIARREYLSYVATPGFWISLGFVPIFMLMGIAVPMLMERATPSRYFSVVDQDGRYRDAIAQLLRRDHAEQARDILKGLARIPVEKDAAEKALAALDAGADLNDVKALLGPAGRTALAAIKDNYVMVAPPAKTEAALRPFLLGDQKVDGPLGPKPLYAAVFINRVDEDSVAVDYWNASITEQRLKGLIRQAVRGQMHADAFARAGLQSQIVRTINALEPRIASLSPEKQAGNAQVTARDTAPFFAAVMFAFILWSVVFSVANMLLTSTIEEKSGKVLDSLLSAAPVRALLSGKLLGVAAVSFTLLSGWAVAGVIATAIGGQFLPPGSGKAAAMLGAVVNPGLIIPFFGYFIFGYLMFGSIFLALGSLCETLQEAQTLMSPLIFILMIPMLTLVFIMKDPDSPILAIVSWIPLFTPFIMMARLPADPPLYQILGTTLVMIVTTVIVLWAAGRVFRAGAMHQAGVDYFKNLLKSGLKLTRIKTS